MTLRPIKFRILQLYSDGQDHWVPEIIKQIQKEYGMENLFGKASINFDILELAAGGMLVSVDQKLNEETGSVIHKYSITEYGKVRASDCCLDRI